MTDATYSIPGEQWIDGARHLPPLTPEVLQKLETFPVHPDDIYVCSYPKAGSVWTRVIIEGILGWEKYPNKPYLNHHRLIELFYEEAIKLPHPDIFKCHLPYHQLPKGLKEGKAKIVHIARNPKDLAVSFFHFHKINKVFGPWDGPWDVFFEHFAEETVAGGGYFDHLRSFWSVKDKQNIFFVEYENLKENPNYWIGKLGEFLERPLDGARLAKIVEDTEFNQMKQRMDKSISSISVYKENASFMRKGHVGDWRNYFTEDQKERIDKKYREFCEEIGRPYHAY